MIFVPSNAPGGSVRLKAGRLIGCFITGRDAFL